MANYGQFFQKWHNLAKQPETYNSGEVVTESIGYMTIQQQLDRFKAAGETLDDFYRRTYNGGYYQTTLNDDDATPHPLSDPENRTNIALIKRHTELMRSYSDKYDEIGKYKGKKGSEQSLEPAHEAPEDGPANGSGSPSKSDNGSQEGAK